MVAILVAGGFFRSLQFTAVNTLTYADLGSEDMSRASSFASMAQQLGISLGVGCAAVVLNLSMRWRGAAHLALADIIAGFIVLGLITAASYFSFRRLPLDAGEHLRRYREVVPSSGQGSCILSRTSDVYGKSRYILVALDRARSIYTNPNDT